MASKYLCLDHTFPDRAEVFVVADQLGIDPDAALGKLVRILIWYEQHTVGGTPPTPPPSLLDHIARQPGFAESLQQCGWLSLGIEGCVFSTAREGEL